MSLVPYEFDTERFSRWMAYVLRHNPARYGLSPDRHGFVDVEEFLRIAQRRYPKTTGEALRHLIETEGTGRFEIAGARLRARYGHSIPVEPSGDPAQPPPRLYYGVDASSAQTALQEGLKPTDRRMLHLSDTREAASAIIQRKTDRPAILCIDAAGASAAGNLFYREGDIFLCTAIPPQFLILEAIPHSATS